MNNISLSEPIIPLKVKKLVCDILEKIEIHYGITIIFCVESGSRDWGLASSNSDYDIRFIYKRPLHYITSLFKKIGLDFPPKHQQLGIASFDFEYYQNLIPNEYSFDFNGWDVRKFYILMSDSNPSIYDWLRSETVYQGKAQKEHYMDLIKYFDTNRLIEHYIGLARGNYRKYIQNKTLIRFKKYLYVIRGIGNALYLQHNFGHPPSFVPKTIQELKDQNIIPDDINELISQIFELKWKGKENLMGKRFKLLDDFIENTIEFYHELARSTKRNGISNLSKREKFKVYLENKYQNELI